MHRFGLRAGGGHQGLVVIEGDHIEDEVRNIGGGSAQQSLGASRAILKMQPDH